MQNSSLLKCDHHTVSLNGGESLLIKVADGTQLGGTATNSG